MSVAAISPLGYMPRAGRGQYLYDLAVEMAPANGYRSRVLAMPGVVRHWYLGDSATAPAIDEVTRLTGGAGNGTYLGNPGAARGMLPEYGLATYFDGIDDRVTIPSGLAGAGAFTVLLWMRAAALTADALLLDLNIAAAGAASIFVRIGGRVAFGTSPSNYLATNLPLTIGVPTLIAASFNPTGPSAIRAAPNGGPFDSSTGILSAFTQTPATGSLGGKSGAVHFSGDLQGVAVFNRALSLAELDTLRAGGVWSSLVDDIENAESLGIDLGIHEDNPVTRIAASGLCTFTLNNGGRGVAYGTYSPGHPNARAGWDRGTMIRVRALDPGGASRPLFVGKVRSIKPTAGEAREKRVQVLATDWLDEAARTPVHGVPTLVDVRADQLIARLLDVMRNKPHGLALAVGSDVYPFALDTSTEEDILVFEELRRIANSERGLIYMRGDGTLVFENRYDRARIASASMELGNVLDADLTRATDDVINRVEVTIHPRRVDPAPVVLYSADSVQSFELATTPEGSTVWLPFRAPNDENVRIGALTVEALTPNTDYTINSEANGSGVDLTTNPNISLTLAPEATGAHLTVINHYGGAMHITKLQIRGRGLYHYDPVTLVAVDQPSIDDQGVQMAGFDMPYQTRIGVAESTAAFLLKTYAAVPTRVDAVPYWLYVDPVYEQLAIEGGISTRVRFVEAMSGLDQDYFVNGKRLDLRAGGNSDVTVWLTAAEGGAIAIFDLSRFDDPAARFAY